jgi:hypothetical protein
MNKDMLLYFDNVDLLKRRVRAVYEIAKGAGCRGMIAGQIADIEAENKQCTKEILDYIHLNKTAALIKAAVRAGAHLGGADKKTLEDLDEYAENLGLAYQIVDDILDVSGNEKEIGKNIGSDEAKKKATYPCRYGLEESRQKVRELTENAKTAREPYYDNAEFFVKLADELAKRVNYEGKTDIVLVTEAFPVEGTRKRAVMAGIVYVDGQRVDKAGTGIREDAEIGVKEDTPLCQRGGLKLEKAIRSFNLDLKGKTRWIRSLHRGFYRLHAEERCRKV